MDYRLRKGEVISMTAAGAAAALSVCAGRVWLTRPGDPRDHLLAEGDRFPFGGGGIFVLEALADAAIALDGVPQSDARATIRVNLALTHGT